MLSASSATEPLIATTSNCRTAVTPRATRLIFTARMPRAEDSSAESTESAASWLCGWNSPLTQPRIPTGCSWSWWSDSFLPMSGTSGLVVEPHEVGVGQVVARYSRSRVLGVVDGVGDQLADVLVLQPVEHLRALPPGGQGSAHAQLRQV